MWGYQHQQPHVDNVTASANVGAGRLSCTISWLLHSAQVDCPRAWSGASSQSLVRLNLTISPLGHTETHSFAFPMSTARLHGERLSCTAAPMYGALHRVDWDVLVEWKRQWTALNFTSAIAFGRTGAHCAALLHHGIATHCEARAVAWHGFGNSTRTALARGIRDPHLVRFSTSLASTEYLDEGILKQLCLLYARASGAQWIAAADLDERPPAEPRRFAQALLGHADDARAWGFLVFFRNFHQGHPKASCPIDFCPSNEREIRKHCPGIDEGLAKPIVMPSRVQELSVHIVAPLPALRGNAPKFVKGPIEWGLCYVHPVRYIV